jgi:phenylacetate-coenzyme A ligase PaaK-like adenylate-forming protein
MQNLIDRIFTIDSEEDFNSLALEIFCFQASENLVYSEYLKYLSVEPKDVHLVSDIPFLPIDFFKTHKVICGNEIPKLIFESSGTTGQQTSKHLVLSESIYKSSFLKSFTSFYGNPEELCILALLPSYLERENSSLVYMMNHLMKMSKHQDSGFYLNNLEELSEILQKRNQDKHSTLLLGVSFALLDLADNYPLPLSSNIKIMETGGMKGRRKEIIREELHSTLEKEFKLEGIHSEYGMTELLSQAYAGADRKFHSPPWMKILIRDPYDPLAILSGGQSGAINIIDLANIYSCSFIATGDLGRVHKDGSFDVAGRMDSAEIRGCNLMVT